MEKIPEYIGNMDGILSISRDKNNRLNMKTYKNVSSKKVIVIQIVSSSKGALQFKTMNAMTNEKFDKKYPNINKNVASSGGNISSSNTPRLDNVSESILSHGNQESNRKSVMLDTNKEEVIRSGYPVSVQICARSAES